VQFGIIQGGIHKDLRDESVAGTIEVGFDAYAIGGLSVGEPVEAMYDVVAHTAPQLPEANPRYLMGTGMPDDLVESVARGIDLFDCVLPTRNARNGQLFTRTGRSTSSTPDAETAPPDRAVVLCQHQPRAYFRHLFVAGRWARAR
jgi:queuine tRNA-ribosyltransferase